MNIETVLLNDQFISKVSDEFESYLRMFPDERNKLSILEKQLTERDKHLCNRKNLTGHLTASALLLNKTGDATFLIYHNFLKLWLQPGGHLEPMELPMHGALREFREETGIENVRLHPWHDENKIPFDMDTHAIPHNEKKDEGSHFHHDFQYLIVGDDGTDVDRTIKIDLNEVSQYRWVSFDELIEKEHDDRLKRVAAKIRARIA